MANTDYIKEFLVKLGYQVDPQSQKKFEESLQKSSKSAEGLAKGLKSVAVALGTASTVAAYRLNALYVNANRIGTSASKLDALGKAISNVGGDANAAAQSVASIAQKLRDIQNFDRVFGRFGVSVKDANGNLRDTVDLLIELINSGKFRELSYAQQSAYMRDAFGIDDLTFRSIRDPEFQREYQKILETNRKLGDSMDKSAESTRRVIKSLNDLKNQGGAVLDLLVGNLMDKLSPALDKVNSGLSQMIDWYSKLSPESQKLAKDIGSAAVAAGMLAASLKAISIFKGIGDIFKPGKVPSPNPGTAGNAASKASGIAVSLFKNPASWLAALGIGSFAADAYMTSKDADSVMNRETQGDLVGLLYGGKKKTKSDPSVSAPSIIPAVQEAELPKGMKRHARGIRNNNPGNIEFSGAWKQQGATREVGNGGRFAAFSTPQEGLRALAIQLKRYDNVGLSTIKDIVTKYAPEKENNTIAYMNAVSRRMGIGINTRLNMSDPAIMQKMMNEIIRFENGYNPYSNDMMREAARFGVLHKGKWRGDWGGSQNLNQNINITVNGAKYPDQSAEAVRDVMENRNGVMFRNARTPSR